MWCIYWKVRQVPRGGWPGRMVGMGADGVGCAPFQAWDIDFLSAGGARMAETVVDTLATGPRRLTTVHTQVASAYHSWRARQYGDCMRARSWAACE